MKTAFNTTQLILLIAMGTLSVIVNMDYSSINLALVTISQQFNVSLTHTQWVLSIYILIWGVLSIPGGKLVDTIGCKKAIIYGSGTFLFASIIAGVANNIDFLIVARSLQALGAALFFPALYSVIGIAYTNEAQRGVALGVLCATTGLGLIAGPFISGIFLEYLSWRWIFYINIPLVGVVIYVFMTQYRLIENLKPLDIKFVPLVLFICSVSLLFIGLNQFTYFHAENKEFYFWLILFTAAVIFSIYLLVQKTQGELINFALFKNRGFFSSIIIQFAYQFSFASISLLFAVYMQNIEKYTAYQTSLYFLTMTVPFAVLSYFGGKLTAIFNVNRLCFWGLILILISLLCFANLPQFHHHTLSIVALLIMGISLGVGFPAMNALMVSSLDPKILGEGSGVFMMLSLLFNSLGLVISISLYDLFGLVSVAFYFVFAMTLLAFLWTQFMRRLKKL